MALGVLNNLSAIYAEHNLNNTSNSLQTVLRQLSSGSRISSGADDAAGSSLVNGLQANSTALSQSVTNATEGVGLLQVADGALSQVTNLLNRAITLATEASNGTLNANQSAAANQEYQSILAEINNIGSTTTYNQQPVFSDRTVSIYTGDSSTSGSSIDNICIRSLSAGNVGDSNGRITYSNGQNNVFVNLSKAGKNAAVTDSLGAANATTTINVSYINKGANGSAVPSTAQISAGAGTIYPNTAQGLIDAINNSGLGVNASFTTAAAAGSAAVAAAAVADGGVGSPSDTGIAIAATGIGTGSSGVGVVGALGLTTGNTLGGTLTIVGADGTSHNITLGTFNSTDTLSNLQSVINAAGYGVTASMNQAGTQLTFTSANPKVIVSGTNLMDIAPAVPTPVVIAGSDLGSITVKVSGDTLGGTITLTPGLVASSVATPNNPVVIQLGTDNTNSTLQQLQTSITAGSYGITASLDQTGTVLTFKKSSSPSDAQGTPAISASGLTDTVATSVVTSATLRTMTVLNAADKLTGTLSGINNAGTAYSIALGQAGTDTLANLETTINTTFSSLGITAKLDSTGTVLNLSKTPTDTGNPTVVGGNFTDANQPVVTVTTPVSGGDLASFSVANATDLLSGDLSITSNAPATTTLTLGAGINTLQDLADSFNSGANSGFGITASLSNNGTTITFRDDGTGGANIAAVNTTGSPVTDSAVTSLGAGIPVFTLTASTDTDLLSGDLSLTSLIDGSTAVIPLGTQGSTDTLSNLATYITAGGFGLVATNTNVPAVGTVGQPGYVAAYAVMTITVNPANYTSTFAPGVSGSPLDAVTAPLASSPNLGTLTVGDVNDTLTGVLDGLEADGVTPFPSISLNGQTLAQLATAINNDYASYGILASLNPSVIGTLGQPGYHAAGTVLTFTSQSPTGPTQPTIHNTGAITTTLPASPTSISLTSVPTPGAPNSTTLGSLAIQSTDTLSGSLTIGAAALGHVISIGLTNNTPATLAAAINSGDYGVEASYDSVAGVMTFTSPNSAIGVTTTNPVTLDPTLFTTPAGTVQLNPAAFNSSGITSSDYYSIGISGVVADSSTGGGTANVGITTDSNGLGGVATTSYSDAPGVNLSTTDLSTQVQAQAALNYINLAITAAAALDGYIGGQINMLNSVSQVLTTQQENVISAQNAIQATDYASAAANLSKYQILSQTGIAALAQANSIQQEVTKLLQ